MSSITERTSGPVGGSKLQKQWFEKCIILSKSYMAGSNKDCTETITSWFLKESVNLVFKVSAETRPGTQAERTCSKRFTTSAVVQATYDAASAVAIVRQTLLHLPNSVRLWMNNYLITFVITRITYCTVSSLHLQQPHKTTIFDRELTANNYRNILDIWPTPIL